MPILCGEERKIWRKMKEENLFVVFMNKILIKLGILEKKEINKKEMCERAVKSSICPKTCENCVWNENG